MAPSRRTTTALACLLGAGLLVPAAAARAAEQTGPATRKAPAASTANAGGTSLARSLALASPSSERSADSKETVSLQLTPRDAAGLAALAKAPRSVSRATRLARLDTVVAGSGRARQVARSLQGLGLTVDSTNDFTVTASGPAGRVDALFGSARRHNAQLATAQTLPTLPTALRGLVTAGWGGDDTRPAVLSHAVVAPTVSPRSHAAAPSDGSLSVAAARALYGIPATTDPPASDAPVIATLQFTQWTNATQDLNLFAAANGIYPSTYHAADGLSQVAVSEPSCMPPSDPSGHIEAALDQEALLVAAPQLRQRMYVAPNCGNAQDDAIGDMIQDVRDGVPIVALSTSWGRCEPGSYAGRDGTLDQGDVDADQNAVDTALALGVTVFAASGDQGSYDCLDTHGAVIRADAVDTPAVIPGVVGVGGTSGTSSLTPWHTSLGASGGGFSCDVFARPTYQAGVARSASFPHNLFGCTPGRADRTVPDIAADAGGGLDTVIDGQGQRIVGTSFSAPLAAGGMAQTLISLGVTSGIGSISPLLYGGGGVTDVTTGSNADYLATPGYDTVTGQGSPHWLTLLSGGSGSNLDVASVGDDGIVSVRAAVAAASWHTSTPTFRTPLQVGDGSDWRLLFAPYGGDRANDLWAVHVDGTASGMIEFQILSQASGYRSSIAHVVVAHTVRPADSLQVRVGSYASDHASDLFLIFTGSTGSGHTEVHVLSASSHYRTYLAHDVTPLPTVGGTWTFLVGDGRGSGDLFGVVSAGTASGRTEIHALSRASGYHAFSLQIATPIPVLPQDGSHQFSLRDLNRDGIPDLVQTVLSGTPSGRTEIHAVSAPSYHYATLAVATAFPPLPPDVTAAMPE